MKSIPSDKLPRIIKAKNILQKALNIKISFENSNTVIDGSPEDEYVAEKVIDALNMGFPLSEALLLTKEENMFEIINIKHHTKSKTLERIRARIIGAKGGTLRTLTDLTHSFFQIKGNEIGIISTAEEMPTIHDAITNLIHGSKHANVYSMLEHQKPIPVFDLGLKEPKKPKKKKAKKEKDTEEKEDDN